MATKPTTPVPDWANSGDTVEPPAAKIAAGWSPEEKPPAEYENFMQNLRDQWGAYFEEAIDELVTGPPETLVIHPLNSAFPTAGAALTEISGALTLDAGERSIAGLVIPDGRDIVTITANGEGSSGGSLTMRLRDRNGIIETKQTIVLASGGDPWSLTMDIADAGLPRSVSSAGEAVYLDFLADFGTAQMRVFKILVTHEATP